MKLTKKAILYFILTGLIIVILFGYLINSKRTKTSIDYLNTFSVSRITYLEDSLTTIKLIDSLIKIEKVFEPAKIALRHFDGKSYNDSINRQWAIDLPMKNLNYLSNQIDTIVYNPNDSTLFAGLLISKIQDKLDSKQISYFGNGFICEKQSNILKLDIKGYRVTNSKSINDCSKYLRKIYFQEMGQRDSLYNMNDRRFWTAKSLKK
jgi:hypothetical protein